MPAVELYSCNVQTLALETNRTRVHLKYCDRGAACSRHIRLWQVDQVCNHQMLSELRAMLGMLMKG